MDIVNIDVDPDTESFQPTALQQLILNPSDLAEGEIVARIIFSMLPCIDRGLYSVFPESITRGRRSMCISNLSDPSWSLGAVS
jgi:hypothetical protein